mmetsp:Transcript_13953/g.41535  ORF Transcript_13953/g.41535 Transcript_13953/m.41535 type:complete len:284 (-) Transcript_13953:90-941(-)
MQATYGWRAPEEARWQADELEGAHKLKATNSRVLMTAFSFVPSILLLLVAPLGYEATQIGSVAWFLLVFLPVLFLHARWVMKALGTMGPAERTLLKTFLPFVKRMIVLSTLHLITVTAVVVYTFEDFPYWVHVVTLLPNIAIRASMMLCILIHVHHLSEYVRVKEAGGYRWNTRSHQRRSGQRVSQQPVPTVYEDEDTKHNPEDPEDPKKPHAEDERSLDSDTAPFASSQGTDEATRVDVGTSIGCIGSSSSSSMAERGLGGSSTDPESSGSEPESSRSLSSS